MQWEKRKPLWPKLAALGILFLLALAAPSAWHSAELVQQLPFREAQLAPENALRSEVVSSEKAVTPTGELPTVVETFSEHSEAPEHFEALPNQYEFSFETLLSLRDTLLQVVDQLPDSPVPPPSPVSPPFSSAAPVRVSGPADRLAMLPPRPQSLPGHGKRREESVLLKSTREQDQARAERNFASLLLEAAKPSSTDSESTALTPEPQVSQPEPRLALLQPRQQPTKDQLVEAAPADLAEPTLAMSKTPATTETEQVTTQQSVEQRAQQPEEPGLEITEQESTTEPQLAEASEPANPKVQPAALKHRPEVLISDLESLSSNSPGAAWAKQVLQELQSLGEPSSAGSIEPLAALARLEQLNVAASQQLEQRLVPTYHSEWLQTNEALARRLPLWRVLLDPQQPKVFEAPESASETLLPILSEIVNQLPGQDRGLEWREYLLIDDLADATSQGIERPTLARAQLAQEVLSRMEDPRLTDEQLQFLNRDLFTQLAEALRPWAASRVDLNILAALIERYESGREARYAEVIAQLQQRLKWSNDSTLQALAEHLEHHYRGANMRIAVSDDLLNRMLPKQEPIVTPVSDRIAGSRVLGRARTTTQLRVRLVPEEEGWHFGLEAYGKVYSDTRSDTWPARVRNSALMEYEARKDIAIDDAGLHVAPTQAEAEGTNRLVGVDSDLDPIPIVGQVLRDMARNKHRKARPLALRQARAKVVRTAKTRMDSAVDPKLDVLEAQFRSRVLQPIEDLALLAEPLDMYTTEDRAVMKLRLANLGQLAAHTPRPLAPSDSVLSMQMHESALNNAMMGLGLDGRRMKMIELFEFFAQRFGTPDAVPPEDLPRAATIEFAARDAVQVQCDGDRLQLILHVVELAHRRDRIRDFQIHVHFRPVLEGLDVKLVRDGTLQFSGYRLKTGPRIVLHSVIGKLIRDDQQITLLNEKVRSDPRFEGLMVTQLVIEDGWVGLALGPAHPRRTAWRAPVPKLLETPFVR